MSEFQLANDDAPDNSARIAYVQTCSQLAAYLPFMALPDSWRGKRVEVRLIGADVDEKERRRREVMLAKLMEPRVTLACNPQLLDQPFDPDKAPF